VRVALGFLYFSSVHLSSVQLSFAITCLLLYNTHIPTHKTYNQTTLPTNSSAYLSLSKLPGQRTFIRSNTKTKTTKPLSSCLADLTTPLALLSLVLPSPPRARSALSSFPFLSNKTMQHLRLDFCYEPACLRSVFLLLEAFSLKLLTPPQGHTVIPSLHACFNDMRTVFAMMISTTDRNKKGFVG
jgi:hypothetical protein